MKKYITTEMYMYGSILIQNSYFKNEFLNYNENFHTSFPAITGRCCPNELRQGKYRSLLRYRSLWSIFIFHVAALFVGSMRPKPEPWCYFVDIKTRLITIRAIIHERSYALVEYLRRIYELMMANIFWLR